MADPTKPREGGIPGWLRVLGIAVIIVVLLVVAIMLVGGPGGHTPPPGLH
ncbi:MAG: hypothetical protein ACR2H0_01680 [Candidatus Limnocylindrales bacterium]